MTTTEPLSVPVPPYGYGYSGAPLSGDEPQFSHSYAVGYKTGYGKAIPKVDFFEEIVELFVDDLEEIEIITPDETTVIHLGTVVIETLEEHALGYLRGYAPSGGYLTYHMSVPMAIVTPAQPEAVVIHHAPPETPVYVPPTGEAAYAVDPEPVHWGIPVASVD